MTYQDFLIMPVYLRKFLIEKHIEIMEKQNEGT